MGPRGTGNEADFHEDALAYLFEGTKLWLSSMSGTGYKGVTKLMDPKRAEKPFQARGPPPEYRCLGYFATAVEGAIAYAKCNSGWTPNRAITSTATPSTVGRCGSLVVPKP